MLTKKKFINANISKNIIINKLFGNTIIIMYILKNYTLKQSLIIVIYENKILTLMGNKIKNILSIFCKEIKYLFVFIK